MTDSERRGRRGEPTEHESSTRSNGRGATSPAADGARRRPACCRARSGRTPTPFQYVMIAVVLVVITAVEIAVSYTRGHDPRRPHRRAAARHGGREVLPRRVVVHAPAHRPAGVPALLHHRVRSPPSCLYSVVLATLHGVRQTEHGADAGRASPSRAGRPTPTSGCSSALLAAGYAIAIVRARARASRPGRPVVTALPGHVLVARRVRDVAGVRLADPRHRRAVQLQRPHGAAPAVHDGRGAAAAARHAGVAAALGAAPAGGCFRTVRMLVAVRPRADRLQPRARAHALAADREREPALRRRALLAARGAVRVVAHRVDAGGEPAARDPAARSRCMRMLYLFVWSVVPTVPASFLTSASRRCTSSTSTCRTCSGCRTLEDQQLAGLIMKIGAGLLLWVIIAVVFFRWAADEERANTPRHGLDELDRELTEMGLRR